MSSLVLFRIPQTLVVVVVKVVAFLWTPLLLDPCSKGIRVAGSVAFLSTPLLLDPRSKGIRVAGSVAAAGGAVVTHLSALSNLLRSNR